MATALAKGLIRSGFSQPDRMIASDVSQAARERFMSETGVTTTPENAAAVDRADVVILAVKPQHIDGVLKDIQPVVTADRLIVSIAAGVPLARLTRVLGADCRVVRVMPNTPCLVGASASAFAVGASCTDDDARFVQQMLSTVGVAFQLPENLLDAVTGLAGSGPAYVYQVIEALADGGVLMGLPRDVAVKLAAQTVLGAAQMVLATGEHPGALKDAVASPAGTTIAGLRELERGGMRGILMSAVEAATRRSQELGRSE